MTPSRIEHFCKLYRAGENYNELDYAVRDFLKPDCYEIVNDSEIVGKIPESDEEPRRCILRRKVVFQRRPPLLHWGTIVGDIVHNLRASLDHIVYNISYRRDPATFENDNTTAFPICDTPSAFVGPKRRDWEPRHEIRGLPDDAKAIIEALQPYHRGDDMLMDPLRILREMDDIDKHRTVHLTGWSAMVVTLDITHVPPGSRVHSLYVRPIGPIESGAVLAELDFTATATDFAVMYMDKGFYFAITFDEGTPLDGREILESLYDLYAYVEGVLNALHRFVPASAGP